MSTLLLIRHGQASFGAANYDVLSDRGIQQSQVLGKHLADRQVHLDAVISGPKQRQRDTARHLLDSARAAGADYPDFEVMDEFDEYPAFAMLGHWVPKLAESDPFFAKLVASGKPPNGADAQRAFEIIVGKWVRDELGGDGLESFREFVDRVERGLTQVMEAQGRGKRVAVVTSGGPISVTLRRAMGLDDQTTMHTLWVIANSSLSEFRYRTSDRLSMVGFNRIPHLVGDMLTYR